MDFWDWLLFYVLLSESQRDEDGDGAGFADFVYEVIGVIVVILFFFGIKANHC